MQLTDLLQAFICQAAPDGGAPQGCAYANLIPILLMFGVIYFLLIRPQQKQQAEHQQHLAALKKGDEVVTQGGIIGRVHAVTDKHVTLEVGRDQKIRFMKSHIAGPYAESAESGGEANEK